MDLEIMGFNIVSFGLTVVGIIIALLMVSILIKKWTVICGPDELLIVSGVGSGKRKVDADGKVDVSSGAKVYQSGLVFTIPYFQTYRTLSLKPRIMDIELKRLPSSNFIDLDIPVNIVYTIGRTPELMQRAAVYLGSDNEIEKLARESAIGEMRSVVATLTTEELIADKDAFRSKAFEAIKTVFDEIGLVLMTVNLKDVNDSDKKYIASLSQRATAQVVNKAQADVAEQERIGAIRMAEENTLRTTQVAEQNRKRDEQVAETNRNREVAIKDQERQTAISLSNIERTTQVETARIEAEREIALAETNREREVKTNQTLADQQVTLADTERNRRVQTAAIAADEQVQLAKTSTEAAIQQATIKTEQVTATNLQEAAQIESETQLKNVRIDNNRQVQIRTEEANRQIHEAALETTTAEKSVVVVSDARVAQARQTIEAEAEASVVDIEAKAEASRTKIIAAAEADAIIMRGKADAEALTLALAAKASGIKAMVEACGGNADTALQMMYVEQLQQLATIFADAMSNIKVDKIVMMGGGSADGQGMLSNLVSDYMGSIPKAHEMAKVLGITLPAVLGEPSKNAIAE